MRAFAEERLAEQPNLAAAMRERWLEWYVQFTGQVGFCWSDLDRLARLDTEHEAAAALRWAVQQGRDAATIALVEGVRYYYNVRELWDDRLAINELRAQAAHRLGDRSVEVLALAQHIEIRSKQGALDEAAAYCARLRAAADGATLSDDAWFEYQHAEALYARACGELVEAERIWRELLAFSARLGGQKYVVNRRWLATMLLEQGQVGEAERRYGESLADARAIHDLRSVTGNTLKLAAIALAQGDLEDAATALAECAALAALRTTAGLCLLLLRLYAPRYHRRSGAERAGHDRVRHPLADPGARGVYERSDTARGGRALTNTSYEEVDHEDSIRRYCYFVTWEVWRDFTLKEVTRYDHYTAIASAFHTLNRCSAWLGGAVLRSKP